ncbi:MAG: radical SAM protein [Candidatus Heimdallarchaeota archaeon]|nr:radical SAM protein [Candidatus Heimdallarchaeota archaeon]MCK4877554.1 radical SAM protein [Candidatus Heimdallarchaeota archaeon]
MTFKFCRLVENPNKERVLIVDFNPPKTCNFNCLYCQLGPITSMINERKMFFPVKEILEEIKQIFEEDVPDITILKGSGEPSLYSGLGKLIEGVRDLNSKTKIKVVTNGSFLHDRKLRREISKSHIIQLNIDTVVPEEAEKINRHHKGVKLDYILEGALSLALKYEGQFNVSVKIIDGVNDSLENIDKMWRLLQRLQPTTVEIGEIKPFKASDEHEYVSPEFTRMVKNIWKDLPFNVQYNFQ